jgi:hypothetical protein
MKRPKRLESGYALDRSYVLLAERPIELVSHPIRAWPPLAKPQRLGGRLLSPLLYH